MFFKKEKYPIHFLLDEFSYNRRYFTTTGSYRRWVGQFIKITGVRNIEDIQNQDISAFIDAVKDITSSEFNRLAALSSIRIFMQFCKQNDIINLGMNKKSGRPKNDLVRQKIRELKYNKNGTKNLSVRKIALKMGIPKSTVGYYYQNV